MLISFSQWHWYADIVVTDANALAGTNFQLFGLASDGSEVSAETGLECPHLGYPLSGLLLNHDWRTPASSIQTPTILFEGNNVCARVTYTDGSGDPQEFLCEASRLLKQGSNVSHASFTKAWFQYIP